MTEKVKISEKVKTSEIVKGFRLQLGGSSKKAMSRAKFVQSLVEGLPNKSLTRQTIYNWEEGVSRPDMRFLMSLYTYHFGKDTWQLRFAAECLKTMHPKVFNSEIIELNLPGGNNGNNIYDTERNLK